MTPPRTFEWDQAKAAANRAKHGVLFETAASVFEDPNAIVVGDKRMDYGEPRWNILGRARGVLLFVTFTDRPPNTRIISA